LGLPAAAIVGALIERRTRRFPQLAYERVPPSSWADTGLEERSLKC
jgi:hypothetical protein